MTKITFSAPSVSVKQFSNDFQDAYTSQTLTDQYPMIANQNNNYVYDKIFNRKTVAVKEGKIYSLGKQGLQIIDHAIADKG